MLTAPSVKVGWVHLTVYGSVMGWQAHIGNYPFEFSGEQSIQGTIMDLRNVPKPGGEDPSPCKPLACCEECGANSVFSIARLKNLGFTEHEIYALPQRKKIQLTIKKNFSGQS